MRVCGKINIFGIYINKHKLLIYGMKMHLNSKKIGATLFSTPFSVRAVKFLEKHKVKLYKIAS